MIREPTTMEEIHKIMEKIAQEEKNLSRKKILDNIHHSSDRLIKKYNLKLKRVKKRATASAA